MACSISNSRGQSSSPALLQTAAYLPHSSWSGGSAASAAFNRRSDLPLSTFLASQGNSRAFRYLQPAEVSALPIRLARSRRTTAASFICPPSVAALSRELPARAARPPPVSG